MIGGKTQEQLHMEAAYRRALRKVGCCEQTVEILLAKDQDWLNTAGPREQEPPDYDGRPQ